MSGNCSKIAKKTSLSRDYGQQDSTGYSYATASQFVSNQERVETTLQARQLSEIIDLETHGVITIDESRRIILFNNAAETMFMCSAAEAIGQPIDRFIFEGFPTDPGQLINKGGEAKANGPVRGPLTVMGAVRANGDEFPIEASISQIVCGKQKIYAAIMTDISHLNDFDESLSGRLISVQDEERRRIARELHDGLNQQMAILCIELQQLGQTIPERQKEFHRQLQSLVAEAQEISYEIRRVAYQLHPSKLDHLGIVAVLKALCEELSERNDLEIEFQHNGIPPGLPTDIRLCIFRIAQESLHNVITHSGARKARVALEKINRAVHLSVSDEGCGFNTESETTKRGLGLVSMRERANLVGGKISIRSRPAHGTEIAVSIPLRART